MANKKGPYDDIKAHGWEKVLQIIVLAITFPFRKWWIVLSVIATVLLVLIAIPSLDGVEKENIWDWYKEKLNFSQINRQKNEKIAVLNHKLEKTKQNIRQIIPLPTDTTKSESQTDESEPQFVAWNVVEFQKAAYKPQKKQPQTKKNTKTDVKIIQNLKNSADGWKEKISAKAKPQENVKTKKQTAKTISQEPIEPKFETIGAKKELVLENFYTKNISNLEYLDEPEKYSGQAGVSGPNSLFVDNKFVFLYGIYTSPNKYNLADVQQYLQDMTQKQTTDCYVVAYDKRHNAATALCFVNGVCINRELVIEDMAENIALRMK